MPSEKENRCPHIIFLRKGEEEYIPHDWLPATPEEKSICSRFSRDAYMNSYREMETVDDYLFVFGRGIVQGSAPKGGR